MTTFGNSRNRSFGQRRDNRPNSSRSSFGPRRNFNQNRNSRGPRREFGDRGGDRGGRGNFDRGTGRRNFSSNRGGNMRRFTPPPKMHDATCAECGKKCQVPFNPTQGKPVYCLECFRKKSNY